MSPKQPKRMDGYVRVSRVGGRFGENFISPKVQREQIEQWARLRGVEIVAWHEDLDQSGGKLDRPGLEALLARIEAKETEGVVVARLDRLSRLGVGDALKLVEQITDAGGSISAVDLGLDPTTTFGEFGMTIMLALARMERRRITESWQTAKERAIARGAFLGKIPLGYDRASDGRLTPNTDAANVVRLFELSGIALDDALSFARQTWPDRYWSAYYLRQILARRLYLGEQAVGDLKGSVPALVDQFTFAAAQHPDNPRASNSDYPLSGIATCAHCDSPLAGHLVKNRTGEKVRAYRCHSAHCTERVHLRAEPLETLVKEAITKKWHPHKVTGKQLQAAVAAVDKQSARFEEYLADDDVREQIGREAWLAGLGIRQQRLSDAQAARDELMAQARATASLDESTPNGLRRLAEQAIHRLAVSKGREPLSERVQLGLAS